MIGSWHAVVIDCEDTEIMADFYEQVLGMVRVQHDDDGWITIGDAPDRPAIAFQRVEGYQRPEWPGQTHPQQEHLDIRVDDLDVAEEAVLKLGATSINTGGQNYRVYLDPQGHPFCLVTW
ncbi:VOC family protein [Arthrobacter sp. JSM 101049]|uniref:VOC family protein n=1 Tax=Arthrobacter sp. JSM 101049 TaxID=929097 RepID=UPI0035619B8B